MIRVVNFKEVRNVLVSAEWSELVKWPWLLNPSLEFQVHDQLVLASQKLHEQLNENVQHVGLVNVANRVADQSPLWMED